MTGKAAHVACLLALGALLEQTQSSHGEHSGNERHLQSICKMRGFQHITSARALARWWLKLKITSAEQQYTQPNSILIM